MASQSSGLYKYSRDSGQVTERPQAGMRQSLSPSAILPPSVFWQRPSHTVASDRIQRNYPLHHIVVYREFLCILSDATGRLGLYHNTLGGRIFQGGERCRDSFLRQNNQGRLDELNLLFLSSLIYVFINSFSTQPDELKGEKTLKVGDQPQGDLMGNQILSSASGSAPNSLHNPALF